MTSPETQSLAGCGVLVTRPAHQAQHLAQLIEQAGGRPILFPVLEILDASDAGPLNAIIDRLDEFDLAIFISPNAVTKAMNLIRARRELPATLKIAAIGRGSSKELKQFGVRDVLAPTERFDSEALLALPELMQVAGKNVVVFRGDGGREALADELIKRGAQLEYAECYRRGKPNASAGALLHHWARNELDAVTMTSGEGLHNLFDLVGKLGQQWLKKTPLFVPHPRLAEIAQGLGMRQVHVTAPGDQGLLDGLVQWYRNRN